MFVPSALIASPSVAGILRQTAYNVRDYGAVGDGTTDDSTAFSNALAAIPSTGGVLAVPAGTYLVQGLAITKPIRLSGQGRHYSILRYNGAVDGTILSVQTSDVEIGGLSFDGQSPAGGKPNFLVVLGAVDNVTVSLCDFKNHIGVALYAVLSIGNGYHHGIRVLDSTFGPADTSIASPEGTRLGVQIGSADVTHYNKPGGTVYDRCLVSRCHFTGNPTEADLCTLAAAITSGATTTALGVSALSATIWSGMVIRVDVGGTVETYVTSAQVNTGATTIPVQSQTAAAAHPAGARIRYEYDSRGDMDGVYFQGCTNSLIDSCSQIYGNDVGFDFEYCQGCVIQGCYAEANVNAGISFFQHALSCQIVGCTTRNNNLDGIAVANVCNDCLVSGCVSYNDGRGFVINDNNATGINGCIDNQIVGCHYSGTVRQNPGGAAIILGQDTLVQGCTFSDVLQVAAIAVGTTIADCCFPPGGQIQIVGAQTWVRSNTFRGCNQAVQIYAQATDACVTHNSFHNCQPVINEPTGASPNTPLIAYNLYGGSSLAPDLHVGSTAVAWRAYSASSMQEGSYGFNSAVTSVTANYSVTKYDRLVLVDATAGAVAITLLKASNAGLGSTLSVKKTDSGANAVSFVTQGADTIDASVSLTAANPKVTLLSDGQSTGVYHVL